MSSLVVTNNLSSVVNSIGRNNFVPNQKAQIGMVFGIVTTENTPTKEMFEKAGGFNGIGSIFYKNIEEVEGKNITGSVSSDFLDKECDIAIPKNSNISYFPLLRELVYLEDLPSSNKKISNTSIKKYYSGPINIWNNPQINSQFSTNTQIPGTTFIQNSNVRPLIAFQGDYILQGRQGSALRFSTTTKLYNDINNWSSVGNENSPIVILSNGLNYISSQSYYVEQINKDESSIYLTSTQAIPLQTDRKGVLNPITSPLNVPDYFNSSQTIINGDRIVLNSKKDEVMLFAKTNIEINTNNIINLNAGERVHLNTDAIFLGTVNNQLPTQPVLLGYETLKVFEHLQETLTKLALYLSSTISTPEGSPIITLNNAGKEMLNDVSKMCDLLEKITSQKVFTS
jgi:hypothetical protein